MAEVKQVIKLDQDEVKIRFNNHQIRKIKLLKKVNNVKADQSPQVIKYMLRRKSVNEIQTPLHDVEFHQAKQQAPKFFFKTFQKVAVDPNLKLDEIREEKWSIVSNNYKSLIEKSRHSIMKKNDSSEAPKPSSQPPKIQFLTRRQSIEFRLREISKNNSSSLSPVKTPSVTNFQQAVSQYNNTAQQNGQNAHLKDPYYDKFKKYYQKIGIQNQEPAQVRLSKLIQMCEIPRPKNNNKSQHSNVSSNQSPQQQQLQQSQSQQHYQQQQHQQKQKIKIKLPKQNSYLKNIKDLQNFAQYLQDHFKKDQNNEINETSHKVNDIQAEFNKFHNMLTVDLDKLDYVEERK